MIYNPYGAVPEALRDTRLTLRDIATDMLMSKKMENDLSLAKSKAETETELIKQGIERDKLNQEVNLAQMAESQRHSQVLEDQGQQHITLAQSAQDFEQGPKFEETKRVNTATIGAHNAAAGLSRAHAAAINNEEKRKNEVVSAKDYATRMGAGFMVDMLGVDPDMKKPMYYWEPMGQSISNILKSSPAMQITATGYSLKSDLQTLAQQYSSPGLDATTKAKIKRNMEIKSDQLQKLDQLIMNVKEPDVVKVAESARKVWAENPQFATQYKSYDDFAQDYANQLKQTRSAFHDDVRNIKTRIATLDIDPDYIGTMKTAQQKISSLADAKLAGQIALGTKNRLNRGDLQGAYDYTINWARSLETTKNNPPSSQSTSQPTYQQQVDSARKANKSYTTATGINLRNIAQNIGLTTDYQTRLNNIARERKAGIMSNDQYLTARQKILAEIEASK